MQKFHFGCLLDRTIFRQVLLAILAVLSIICSIDILFALLDELSDLSEQFTFIDALLVVLLQIPVKVIEFASVASLIGALVVLGLMASHAELVVIRAAGWSQVRVLLPALAAALAVAGLSLLLAEYVVPWTNQMQNNHGQTQQEAVWFRDGDTFARAARVTPRGDLMGLTLFDLPQGLKQVRQVERARYNHETASWTLFNIRYTQLQGAHIQAGHFAETSWRPEAGVDEIRFTASPVDGLSLSSLYNYIDYRQEQGLDVRRHLLRFWQTLLQPFGNLVMVLLASSLVFGSMRMVSMGYRLTVGLMFGLGFYYAQDLFGFLSLVYGWHPLLTMCLPLLGFAALAVVRLRQAS